MSELLFEPADRSFRILQRVPVRFVRTRDHHHGNAKPARRFDLRIDRSGARILADHHLDPLLPQKRGLGWQVERTPVEQQLDIRRQRDTIRRIDHPRDVMMLWAVHEGAEFLAAETEKYTLRLRPERVGRGLDISDIAPKVIRLRLPTRSKDRGERNCQPLARGHCVERDLSGVGMRRIDHRLYGLLLQPRDQTLDAAETAAPGLHRLLPRIQRASGQRQRRLKTTVGREQPRQLRSLRRTSENENAHRGLFRDG
jgi:hypothetical protein